MDPKSAFDAAIARAQHLLKLYDILHDVRQRGVRKDWATKFKKLTGWPAGEEIVRVDGKDRNSMLILRESIGVDRQHFAHDYLSELLRASVVAAVSALDRYLHDQVVKHCWKLLSRAEDEIPKKLKEIDLSPLVAKRALEKLRKNPKARPGGIVKEAIQQRLHKDYTFQSPSAVVDASKMLGLKDFWSEVASRMPGSPPKADVEATLREITYRRNRIVHEADLIQRTRHSRFKLREIGAAEAANWVSWMSDFVGAIDAFIGAELG